MTTIKGICVVYFGMQSSMTGLKVLVSLDTWKMREFLAYAGTATNRWGATGNGSENCRQPSRTCGWRYFRTLRFFFNWVVQEGLVEKSPLWNIKPQAPKQKPIEPYTQKDMKKMLDVCETDYRRGSKYLGVRNKAIIMLFVDTGMRLSELANLKLKDMSMETGRACSIRQRRPTEGCCF